MSASGEVKGKEAPTALEKLPDLSWNYRAGPSVAVKGELAGFVRFRGEAGALRRKSQEELRSKAVVPEYESGATVELAPLSNRASSRNREDK